MERLWAPWRLEYVGSSDEQGGCFLCEAARAECDREKLVLWRGQRCFCVINRWPYNNGHLMVAPLEHRADLGDLCDADLLEMMQMLRRCRDALAQTVRPSGFNLGLNLGKAGGAGLADHLHWHIVPRWQGDTNFMPVLADTKVIPQSLDSLWELLRRADSCA
jgi:ATP adenylyltransferase